MISSGYQPPLAKVATQPLSHPAAALVVVGLLLLVMLAFLGVIIRAAKRRLFRQSPRVDPSRAV